VIKDGVKTKVTERRGGVWKSSNTGFLMKGSGIREADSDEGVWNPALLDSDDRGFPPYVRDICDFLQIFLIYTLEDL
jgi:hypothetical protein